MSLLSTAYHEAGHAVAAWALGVNVGHVSVIPDGDSHGRLLHARSVSKRDLEAFQYRTSLGTFEGETSALRTAVISLAGVVAQRRYAPRSVRNWHGDSDYKNVVFVAEQVCHGDEGEMRSWYRRALRRTERLIAWKWQAVEALAGALIEKRELSGSEALAAMRRAYQSADA